MSALFSTVGSILEKIGAFITCSLTFYNTITDAKKVGMCIPKHSGIEDIVQLIKSDSSMIIDLDKEIRSDMDEDDLKKLDENKNLSSARVLFTKAKVVVDEIKHIVTNSTKSVNQFIFLSSDYHLLKFCDCVNIRYMVPSESYHSQLQLQDNWDEASFTKYKHDLLDRKSDKLIPYTSRDDLINQFVSLYADCKVRV